MIKVLKFRIKDKYCNWLNNLAKEVNFVWNYVNDLSFRNIRNRSKDVNAAVNILALGHERLAEGKPVSVAGCQDKQIDLNGRILEVIYKKRK